MKKILSRSGFTLIELIIVIAIIGLLAAAAFVAVDPAKRIGDANNVQRWSDVTAIAEAYQKYLVDNNGDAPTTTPCISDNIPCAIALYNGGTSTSDNCAASTTLKGTIWLDPIVDSGYLGEFPRDPQDTGTSLNTTTGYYFATDANSVVTVGACETYNSEVIKVTR